MYDLNLIAMQWRELRKYFSKRIYQKINALPSGRKVQDFCTYHTSMRLVITSIASLYSEEMQSTLDKKLGERKFFNRVRKFLNKYPVDTVEGKGMRVLLLYLLDIGEAIRDVYRNL